ncbi:MAG: hypothetical protein R3B96_15860 [Pirellulaceae bacterium]
MGKPLAATPSNEPRTTSAALRREDTHRLPASEPRLLFARSPQQRERKVARLVTGGDDVAKLTRRRWALPQLVIKETTTTEKRRTEESNRVRRC